MQLDCEQRRVRFRRDLADNVVATYHALRKRAAMAGDGTTSTRQLARDLYVDVGNDIAAWRRKRKSVQRWLALLHRHNLISREEAHSAAGKCLGLHVDLEEVPEPIAMIVRRGCSSVGSTVSSRVRRLPAAEFHRRWCPRAGRGAPPRFSRPPGLLLGSAETGAPRAPGRVGPIGASPPGAIKVAQAARARGPEPPGLSVATSDESLTDARTALHGRVVRAAGVVAAEAWDAAEEAFAVHCGAAARLEAWRDSEHARHRRPGQDVALRHVPTIGRLCRALSRIDRYAGAPWGVVEPQPGAGVRWLVARIAAHAAQARLGLERWPLSLAYFIPIAEEEGRRLKHEGAPRVKDARIAAGKRPPRRREGRPGRGPALGRDPRLDRPRRERYSARGQ